MFQPDASVNEVRIMIEGKLRELSHNPTIVQVVVSGTSMTLWGEDGEFLSIAEPSSTGILDSGEDEQNVSEEHSEVDDGGHKVEQIQIELQEAKAEIQTLRDTNSSLQTTVDQGKDHKTNVVQ